MATFRNTKNNFEKTPQPKKRFIRPKSLLKMSSRKKNTTSSINRIGLAADQSLLGSGSTVYQSAKILQGNDTSLMLLPKFDSNYGSNNNPRSFPIENHPIDSFQVDSLPLLYLEVHINENEMAPLMIFEKDDIDFKLEEFAAQHYLDDEKRNKLLQTVTEKMNSLNDAEESNLLR